MKNHGETVHISSKVQQAVRWWPAGTCRVFIPLFFYCVIPLQTKRTNVFPVVFSLVFLDLLTVSLNVLFTIYLF